MCSTANTHESGSDSGDQDEVLAEDCDSLGMLGTEESIFEETDKVELGSLLEGKQSWALEFNVGSAALLTAEGSAESLEWELPDEPLGTLLVSTDLTESNSAWLVSMLLCCARCRGGSLSCGLGDQLLSWGLTSCGYSWSLSS